MSGHGEAWRWWVVGGGFAFSCSRGLSPAGSSWFCLGRKRVGFGKPGFGRQTETFFRIE